MRQNQEDFLTMTKQVRSLLNANLAKITPIAAITDTSDELQLLIDEIASMYLRQQKKSQGATIDKKNARNKLSKFGIQLAGSIEAYAIFIGNNELKKNFHYSNTGFDKFPDTEFLTKIQDVHSQATLLQTVLSTYGVTPALLTDFQTAITAYTQQLEKPRGIINEKESATQTLEEILESVRLSLEKLDVLMRHFLFSDPLFYKDYTNARKIINYGHHFTRTGLFIELEDGVDAVGTIVTLTNNKNGKTYTATAGHDGNALVSSMMHGTYTLEIARTGYQTYTDYFLKILKGKNNELSITLHPE